MEFKTNWTDQGDQWVTGSPQQVCLLIEMELI